MKKLLLFLLAACTIASCDTDYESGPETNADSFNRKALLEHTADNIIIPAYQDLAADLATLENSVNAFTTTPNENTLQTAKTAFMEAYLTWQYVEMFNIGKAEDILYAFQMNIYPTNITDIQNNITAGSYNLSSPNNNDAVGFPAVEYMLYGQADTDAAIVAIYSNGAQAAGTKTYLNDLVNQMQNLTITVLNDWIGSYRNSFVNSTGNSATSAINQLINDYIFYFEKGLRANKIGIPAGVFSNGALSTHVESFYNPTRSKELAQKGLQASVDFFNGTSYNDAPAGESFANYARTLRTNAYTSDLTLAINNQMESAKTKLATLNPNFREQIAADNSQMTLTYDEMQRVVVLLKVDLLQTLNINVDYVDSDGD